MSGTSALRRRSELLLTTTVTNDRSLVVRRTTFNLIKRVYRLELLALPDYNFNKQDVDQAARSLGATRIRYVYRIYCTHACRVCRARTSDFILVLVH